MENLDKLKSKRSDFSKLISKLETFLTDDIDDTKADELLEIQEILLLK